MFSSSLRQAVRPLAGALALAPGTVLVCKGVFCEDKPKPAFVQATCTENIKHTADTRLITFKVPNSTWSNRVAISNVTVKVSVEGKQGDADAVEGCCACCKCPPPCGCPKGPNGCCACCKCPGKCECPKSSTTSVARPYNPLCLGDNEEFTLLVKKYKDAKMGTQLHGLKVGEHVEVKGPNQQWRHVPGKYKQYTMVAGGTGITPLIQATRCILAKDTAKVKMITFNKTSSDVLLKDELDYLAKTYPGRLEVVHYVETGDKAGCKQASRDCMPRALKDNLPGAAEGSLVMVCGPQAMTAAVAGPKTPDFKQGDVGGHLKELGYTSNMVWKV